MAMRELLNVSFQVPFSQYETLDHWRKDIQPNLPFADVHFNERVGGEPTNPGEAWKIWPWGNNASKFLEHQNRQFSHTYQERFWPKQAGYTPSGRLDEPFDPACPDFLARSIVPRFGIRYDYADLTDLVRHLGEDPLSRQAYLPIWFPEDGNCKGRKPCTLGYHFIMRHEFLHLTYYIRSCDFIRHWADDCYLAVRLQLWLLDQLRQRDDRWNTVSPGLYTMHIVSLHMFLNDFNELTGGLRGESVAGLRR
jgi:thymidylate synthase